MQKENPIDSSSQIFAVLGIRMQRKKWSIYRRSSKSAKLKKEIT